MRLMRLRGRTFPADAPYQGMEEAERHGMSLARLSAAMTADPEAATYWLCEMLSPTVRHVAVAELLFLSREA